MLGLLQLLLDLVNGPVLALRITRLGNLVLGPDRLAISEDHPVGDLLSFSDRLDRDADRLNTAIDLQLNAIAHDAPSGYPRVVQCGAQIGAQAWTRHGDNVAIGRAGGGLQILSGPRREIECLAVFVDDDESRREMLDNHRGDPPQVVRSLNQPALSPPNRPPAPRLRQ